MKEKNRLSYYSYAPSLKRPRQIKKLDLRKTLTNLAVLCFAVIFLQFLYPWDKTLPWAHVGEVKLDYVSAGEARTTLSEAFNNWSRTIKTASSQYPVVAGDIGLQIDAKKTVGDELTYTWWQRLVPGSFLWRLVNSNVEPSLNVDAAKLGMFADKVHTENYVAYKNASITVSDGVASIVPDADGEDYAVDIVEPALKDKFFLGKGELKLSPKILQPTITKNRAEPTLEDAQKVLSTPPKYVIGDKQGDITQQVLGAWLSFTENEPERRLDLGLNQAAIQDYLNGLYPYTYKTVAGTAPGDSSHVIDITGALSGFGQVLQQKGEKITVTIPVEPVTDELAKTRSYSPSQLGLRALVEDVADEKGDYAIAVQELGGRGWSASVNGDEEFTPASTYKLFVAYAVLTNIETGVWSWGGSIAGTTVEDCFDAMILYSDNACAEAFGNTIGWKKIEAQMRNLGLKDTVLNSGDFISTANDELIFMTKLGRGEILSQASRDKLIDVMKRQVYRDGIPAGVEAPVADKVGFLYGLLHDAALVYAPQGTFALVILTNNSSWSDIADAANRLYNILD